MRKLEGYSLGVGRFQNPVQSRPQKLNPSKYSPALRFAGDPNLNEKPPEKPKRSPWFWRGIGILVGVGWFGLPFFVEESSIAPPLLDKRLGLESQNKSPSTALVKSGNFLESVDEVVKLSRQGHLKRSAQYVYYKDGPPLYQFTTQDGKTLYLPEPSQGDKEWMIRELKAPDHPYPVTVSMKLTEENNPYLMKVIDVLPLLLLIGVGIYGFRNGMSFLKSRSGIGGTGEGGNDPVTRPNTRFKDIGGYPEVVKQLEEVLQYIEYIKQDSIQASEVSPKAQTEERQDDIKDSLLEDGLVRKEATKKQTRPAKSAPKRKLSWPDPPKGILLTGPSGTGKTYMASAIAGEAGIPFINKAGSSFVEMFVGNGAKKVRELFEQARKLAAEHGACIIFIDEIDALGKAREGMGGVRSGGSNDEREQTLNQLLVEMDGLEKEGVNNVILIGATNRPGVLDPALVRAGRFEMKVEIPLPVTPEQRKDILEKHCEAKGLDLISGDEPVDLMELALLTPGTSGADLELIVKKAKSTRWQEVIKAKGQGDSAQVKAYHFREAIQDIAMGPRRNYKLPEKDRRTVAIHEVGGHGLVGQAAGIPSLVISMVARNKSMGHVIPDPRAMSSTFSGLDDDLKRLLFMMGGQAAESVMNGPHKITKGASQDYKQARGVLVDMLNSGMFEDFNMSDYQYADQPFEKEDRAFMNAILKNGLATAVKIIEQVPKKEWEKLLEASIKAGELQGKEAMMFYKNTLGPTFDWAPLEKLVQAFIEDPTGALKKDS